MRAVPRRANDVTLFVKTLAGKSLTITGLHAWSPLYDLKRKVQEKEGVPVQHQRLLFSGLQMEDDRRLCDYNVLDEATVHLVLKMRGG